MCINAKAETIDKLPSFREAFEKRRCIVPADGSTNGAVPRSGESRYGFIRQMAPYSFNRMPVILDEVGAADWMNGREPDPLLLKRLLMPAPDDLLVVRPASPLVNSVKNEGPELLEDLSLFGQ
jgi:putative SOS response-associated peptidase YedK